MKFKAKSFSGGRLVRAVKVGLARRIFELHEAGFSWVRAERKARREFGL